MKESEVRLWMKDFAGETPLGLMPEVEFLWARARLEAEFEQRRKLAAPLFWMKVALQTAAVVAFAVTVAGLAGN